MYRAINLKIEHAEIINELEHIHNIFLQEYNAIIQMIFNYQILPKMNMHTKHVVNSNKNLVYYSIKII